MCALSEDHFIFVKTCLCRSFGIREYLYMYMFILLCMMYIYIYIVYIVYRALSVFTERDFFLFYLDLVSL